MPVPHFGNETVRVHVYRLHTTAGDGHLAALAWCSPDLPGSGTRETTAAQEEASRRASRMSDEVSAIPHEASSAVRVYPRRMTLRTIFSTIGPVRFAPAGV